MRSGRRALLAAIAAGVGLLLALAAGEVAIRLAGALSPRVRYLATTAAGQPEGRYRSLQDYLAARPEHVVPHRPWFNYWTNALGFHDEEFVVPKPAGRFRVMAVGDSFTYGLVPYPVSVMTVLEDLLRAACPGRDLDVLNFGIAGAGVRDYRALIELATATYAPDLVLINFYAGNDAPDLFHRGHENDWPHALLRRSHLWTYAGNALRLWWGVPDPRSVATSVQGAAPATPPPGVAPRGGHAIDPGRPIDERDPALVGPIFSEAAFDQILAEELGRLYVPTDREDLARLWRRTLATLDEARADVARHGARLAIDVYPSAVQVDADLRAALIDRLHRRRRYAALDASAIDPGLPERLVVEYCRSQGLACLDLTPAFVRARAESPEPLYKARDAHWTIRGNLVAARAQAAHLAPLVCPPGPAGS